MLEKKKILLYGRTNAGKTAQLGELAEYAYELTKKEWGTPGYTRLYTGDRGGIKTIQPYVNLKVVDPHILGEGRYATSDPWIFLNQASQGRVKNDDGKWGVDARPEWKDRRVACYAFESMRSFAELIMSSMAGMAGKGVNIGGGSNTSFDVAGEGEKLKISGNNMAHFGVAQQRMTDEIWRSQGLDAPFILWTSSVSKDEDTAASGKVLGPDVIGKALTVEVPRWFDLTFRVDVIPAQQGKPEQHVLYLGTHVDLGAGNAAGLGNIRLPLDAPKLETIVINPASIRKALTMLEGGTDKAEDVIAKRMGIVA